MKAYGQNPWLVENLDDFNFLCCPECAYKSKDDEAFIEHAIEKHPKSKESAIFSPDFDVKTVTWGPGICSLCDKQFQKLREHVEINHTASKPWKCEIENCDFAHSKKWAIERHMKKRHNNIEINSEMEGAVKKIKNLIKVVKVINVPKKVEPMEVPEREDVEKNLLVKMEDPDDFSAVESIKDEYIDGKLVILIILFKNIKIFFPKSCLLITVAFH